MKDLKSGVLMSVSSSEDQTEIETRFKKIVQNTKRFNRGFIKSKTIKRDNGVTVEFRRKATNELYRSISLLTDNNLVKLSYQDYGI